MRGAESSEADRAAWAAQAGTPTAPAQPGWQKWVRFWWIPALAIALAVGYFTTARRGDDGSLTGGGQLSVLDLQAGDCFNAGDEEEISDVDGVPCNEAHAYEAYLVEDHSGSGYPTEAEWESVFVSRCIATFEDYVGAPYETSTIYASMMTPTAEGWNQGDHEYVCYLFEPAPGSSTAVRDDLAESFRGAAR